MGVFISCNYRCILVETFRGLFRRKGYGLVDAHRAAQLKQESVYRIPERPVTAGAPPHLVAARGVSLMTERLFLIVVFPLITLMFVSCTAPGTTYKVATTSTSSGFGLNAGLEGQLDGQTNGDGTACFWITNANVTTVLLWPRGFSAQGNPLEINDDKGRRLAQVGKQIALRGGLGQTPPAGPIFGCSGTHQVWVVAEVVPLSQ